MASKQSQNLRRVDWKRPDTRALKPRFAVADSVLEDFVAGHAPSAVLRELVQNEFDAGGTKVELSFGKEELNVYGNGSPIDTGGWKRLSVMMGSGKVGGSDRVVEAKVNGIGSKNFGMRSLFRFGDEIFVRSGGKWTFLNISEGSLEHPEVDLFSLNRKGIQALVPYRKKKFGGLETFGIEQEQTALDSFFQDLAPILIKLCRPGSDKSLDEIAVSSQRCNQNFHWRQLAKWLPTSVSGITVIQRKVQVRGTNVTGEKHGHFVEEMEFLKVVRVPIEWKGQKIPDYFKTTGGRIRIGVSFRLKRGKLDAQEPGIFYYPLGASQCLTGTAVSLCAPFDMNPDRSQIHDPNQSQWNEWLVEQLANLTMELLVSDWLQRFGADAFLALQKVTQPSTHFYLERIHKRLSEESCWPTRETSRGRKRAPIFAKAADLVIPEFKELDGFLSSNRYLLDFPLHQSEVRRLVMHFGAPRFSLNSLVRLRCAGKDAETLNTKTSDGEAVYYYSNLPKSLANHERQIKFAQAFDTFSRKLSTANRKDLKESPTTLAENGSLQAPSKPLIVIGQSLAPAVSIPPDQRLHSSLLGYKTIAKLCQQFDIIKWVRAACVQAQEGDLPETDLLSLYKYIISNFGELDGKTVGIIKNSPVLRDHQGQWVTPTSIIKRRAPGASRLEPALHFPHRDYNGNIALAGSLNFRQQIDGNDLVNYARVVESHPNLAEDFEDTLWRFKDLLTLRIITDLSDIEFLKDSSGGITKPSAVYIRTTLTSACVGTTGVFVVGSRLDLYKQLDCMGMPRSQDIVSYLASLRDQQMPPGRPEILYPALVEVLKKEGLSEDTYKDEQIAWIGGEYVCPSDVLLGKQYPAAFLDAVPIFTTGRAGVRRALGALGACSQPKDRHWSLLFNWIGEKYSDGSSPLLVKERRALREAYSKLNEIPDRVLEDSKFLLDKDGKVHSIIELRNESYVIDDEARIADSATQQGIPMVFADTNDIRSLRFYASIGAKPLSGICLRIGAEWTDEVDPPSGLNLGRVLSRLHSEYFSSALSTLVAYEFRNQQHIRFLTPTELQNRLQSLKEIVFTRELKVRYQILGTTLDVAEEVFFEGDRIVCTPVRSLTGLRSSISLVVAGCLIDDKELQRALVDPIYRLLDSSSSRETERYLRNRGIAWDISPESLDAEPEDGGLEEEPEDQLETNQLRELLADAVGRNIGETDDISPSPVAKTPLTSRPPENRTEISTVISLPDLDQVKPRLLGPAKSLPDKGRRSAGDPNSTWTPPNATAEENKRLIGRQGEEIIYLQEIERVKASGFPESRVVWTSDSNPGANHDIVSVGEDGEDIWIEVKSTTGKHGWFPWSKPEFDLAVKKRDRYIIWRVYEIESTNPPCRPFPDPIGLLLSEGMRLDIDSLHAEVGPVE